jgi:predicted transcriptional regulator
MKNVTITLDDEIATRVDAEAASRGKSVSKFVSELIEREIGPKDEITRKEMTGLEAIQEFLSGPDLASFGDKGRPATRQNINDERIDELVRRYERSNLRNR